jgi:hypothetical protein
MRHDPPVLSRRQLFVLAGAAARMEAASTDEFWNTKPPEEWSAGDKYRLANHSPWANPVEGRHPNTSLRLPRSQGGGVTEPGPKGVVTWESAQPIRDALKTPLPRVFANYYVIGVDGIPLGNSYVGSLRRYTALRSTGKAKWTVGATAARELIRNSAVYAFGFSKAAALIGPDTGDVVFETQFGEWFIQAKFKPKDMLYHGQLAL